MNKADEVRNLLAEEHAVDEWDSTDATIIKIVEDLEKRITILESTLLLIRNEMYGFDANRIMAVIEKQIGGREKDILAAGKTDEVKK